MVKRVNLNARSCHSPTTFSANRLEFLYFLFAFVRFIFQPQDVISKYSKAEASKASS